MSLTELSKKYGVHPTQIGTWKRAAIENIATAFTRRGAALEQVSAAEVDKLYSKIAQLVVKTDFLVRASQQLLGTRGKKMVSKDHKLSVRRQCALLTFVRPNLYYEAKGENAETCGS